MLLARGKPTAYFIVAVFIGVLAFVAVRMTSGPQLYTGDKLETRTCRWCSGSGQYPVEGHLEKCPGCGGSKTVQVILPGPEHPAPVQGIVSDKAAPPPPPEEKGKLRLLKGGVPDAKLSFKGPEPLEITSQGGGRYKCSLKPGDYSVTVTADGFQDLTTTFTVVPLKNPLWQERTHFPDAPENQDILAVPLALTKK